jgi:ribosomal protein S18 acetylase RimI-like enzyme
MKKNQSLSEDNCTIQRIVKKDAPHCARLVSEYLGEPFNITKSEIKDMLTWDKDECVMYKVITKLRQIVGFGAVVNEKWNTTAEIEWIVLVPDYRGKGLGKNLIRKMEEYALDNGARKIFVDTGEDSEKAKNFYFQNGYIQEGRLSDYYADHRHAVVLSKRLKPIEEGGVL